MKVLLILTDLEIGIANWKFNLTKVNPNLSLRQSLTTGVRFELKTVFVKSKILQLMFCIDLLGGSTMFCTWFTLILFLHVVVVVKLSCWSFGDHSHCFWWSLLQSLLHCIKEDNHCTRRQLGVNCHQLQLLTLMENFSSSP